MFRERVKPQQQLPWCVVAECPGVRVPGMGSFERVDLPLPLLLQAADRRVRSSAAFGQREEPIHPLVTAPLGCAGGSWRSEQGERRDGEERCSALALLRLAAASSAADDSVFSSLLCGGAAGSTVMSLLLAPRRCPAVCPQGHRASWGDGGKQSVRVKLRCRTTTRAPRRRTEAALGSLAGTTL